MNTNAHVNLFARLLLCVVGTELSLNLLRTLHGVDDGGEVYQEGVAHNLNDRAVMLSDRLANDVIMHLEQPQHAGLVAAHLAAEAHDVGEHDRGQPSRLCGLRTGAVLWHGSDYRAGGL